MEIQTFTETGKRRRNEDRLDVVIDDSHNSCFAVLSDGMGGHECGDEAAELVVEKMCQAWRSNKDVPPCESKIAEAIQRVGIEYEINARQREMGATLVAVYADKDTAILAHCGDSRIYLTSPDGSVRYRTEDHCREYFGWHLVDNAFFTGRCRSIKPEMSRHSVSAGYRIMLCSDGVSGFIPEEELWDRLTKPSTLQEACQSIKRAASLSSLDNFSAILIEI